MLSALPSKARALKVAQPTGNRWAGTTLLLNAIKILPTHLLGRTAYLKLPKSFDVRGAIALSRQRNDNRTNELLQINKANFVRRAIHPRPKGRGFSRNSGNLLPTMSALVLSGGNDVRVGQTARRLVDPDAPHPVA